MERCESCIKVHARAPYSLPSPPPVPYPVTPSPGENPLMISKPDPFIRSTRQGSKHIKRHSPWSWFFTYNPSLRIYSQSLSLTITYSQIAHTFTQIHHNIMPFIYPSYRYRSYLHPMVYNDPIMYGGMGMGMSMPIGLGMGMGMGMPYPTAIPVPIANPVPISVPVPIPASAPVYSGYGMTAPPLQYQVCPRLDYI